MHLLCFINNLVLPVPTQPDELPAMADDAPSSAPTAEQEVDFRKRAREAALARAAANSRSPARATSAESPRSADSERTLISPSVSANLNASLSASLSVSDALSTPSRSASTLSPLVPAVSTAVSPSAIASLTDEQRVLLFISTVFNVDAVVDGVPPVPSRPSAPSSRGRMHAPLALFDLPLPGQPDRIMLLRALFSALQPAERSALMHACAVFFRTLAAERDPYFAGNAHIASLIADTRAVCVNVSCVK